MSSSSSVPINSGAFVAPTPQNTPLSAAPIASHMSRPTVADIPEAEDGDEDSDSPPDVLRQAALAGIEGKLSSLIGRSSGYIESLPVPIKRRVEGLKGVQAEYAKIEMEQKKEILELDKKYLALYTPLFLRRYDILTGKTEPTADEITAGEAQSLKDDPDATPLPSSDVEPGANDATGVPHFWLTALRNHVGINDLITERDEGALKHLVDIRLEYLEAPRNGFKLLFYFDPNEYFEDKVLTKEYIYQDEIGYGGDFVYDRANGCTIQWKEDKDLTKEVEIKKQRNKSEWIFMLLPLSAWRLLINLSRLDTNRTRLVRRTHPTASFFNFFSPPEPPSQEAIEAGDIDGEELEELEERLELDYQIGEDLKERIIPRAIDYFTGKALEYEGGLDDDEDFEDDDDEDEDGGFVDDDSDDEGGVAPPRKRGGKTGNENVDPAECKQQ
ncbi:hypothetical protein BOTBODRAFT_42656 [Botryobasidium botryosum FD-172 SS1]|uniref:Nucleosome assembly protein n=1 Tax=Botryobasidium botryosum (strain FD-172 SS1) TaxID=930990 RepID=A0A067MNX7_BOTB1|nr:hypothetical protein BOTBODRAFT_42656 [Botryobasidium botryosum FD-172 SS1]